MAKKSSKKQADNYLEYIPMHHPDIKFSVEDDKVTIFVENKGLFNRMAQLLFKKPKVSQIHLDEMGNFIWPLIDGSRNILELAELVKAEFGDKAEPLYNRLVQYMRNLEAYHFIIVKK